MVYFFRVSSVSVDSVCATWNEDRLAMRANVRGYNFCYRVAFIDVMFARFVLMSSSDNIQQVPIES